jgi:hypothetical protein
MLTPKPIDSWQRFEELSKKWTSDGPYGPNIYRGQSDASWELVPSLTRTCNEHGFDKKTAMHVENELLFEFQQRYRNKDEFCESLKINDLLSWWEIMQHHSAPTRLLDWSKSPHAALYFAVSSSKGLDGAIYVMDAGHLQWIQSVRAKDPADKPNWAAFQELNKSVNGQPYKKSMVIISSPLQSERMLVQQSSFSLSTAILESHDVTGDEIVFNKVINYDSAEHSIFYKFQVPNKAKHALLNELEKMGYTGWSLFPDERIMDKNAEDFRNKANEIIKKYML